MQLNILLNRSLHVPLNEKFPSAPADSSIRSRGGVPETNPVCREVMPWGVLAAYAAALASTGFLFVMALTGGFHLG
jgi:hypothetical protein